MSITIDLFSFAGKCIWRGTLRFLYAGNAEPTLIDFIGLPMIGVVFVFSDFKINPNNARAKFWRNAMGFNGLALNETITIGINSRYRYLHFMKAMTLKRKIRATHIYEDLRAKITNGVNVGHLQENNCRPPAFI